MLIRQALDRAVDTARKVKEDHLATLAIGASPDLPTFIEGYRGNDGVILVSLPLGRDQMLDVARLVAQGMGVDLLATTTETFIASSSINPLTGEAWGPDELGEVFTKHDGGARGWVSEALVTVVVNRAGDIGMAHQRFRLDGTEITWGERDSDVNHSTDKRRWGGIVPTGLVAVMNASTLAEAMPPPASISPTHAQAIQDATTVHMIGTLCPDAVAGVRHDPTNTEYEQAFRGWLDQIEKDNNR